MLAERRRDPHLDDRGLRRRDVARRGNRRVLASSSRTPALVVELVSSRPRAATRASTSVSRRDRHSRALRAGPRARRRARLRAARRRASRGPRGARHRLILGPEARAVGTQRGARARGSQHPRTQQWLRDAGLWPASPGQGPSLSPRLHSAWLRAVRPPGLVLATQSLSGITGRATDGGLTDRGQLPCSSRWGSTSYAWAFTRSLAVSGCDGLALAAIGARLWVHSPLARSRKRASARRSPCRATTAGGCPRGACAAPSQAPVGGGFRADRTARRRAGYS